MVTQINPEEVEKIFMSCLFKEEELVDGTTPTDAVIVHGIVTAVGFNRTRLNEQRETVLSWLRLLPITFRNDSGGGWSFLTACEQEDGHQWTGLHLRMEQLFMLGIGMGYARWLFEDRKLWGSLPGGMPYITLFLPS